MSLLTRLGTFAALVATLTAPAHAPTPVPPALTFVSASNDASHGSNAVDGDRSTVWLGIAKRKPAWIVVRLKHPIVLLGVSVTTYPMPANTFYTVSLSSDGKAFHPVLENLRNTEDAPVVRAFAQPQEAAFIKLSFENGSRHFFVPLIVRELAIIPETAPGSVVGRPDFTPPASVSTTAVVPTPRILGAVVGTYDGERALVVVGDGFAYPVESVRADGHELSVIGSTATQILCTYPHARTPRLSITLKTGGRTVSRTVSTVSREIRWVAQSPKP